MPGFVLALAAIIVVILLLASRKPDEFRVMRTLLMNAAPETVFAEVNDFHRWDAWSPWAKLDPNATVTFEGPGSGVGAVMRWEGNNKIGKGSQIIMESVPHSRIVNRLDFLKPMKGTSTLEFTFTPQNGQTLVAWSMYGKNNFMARIMTIFINCEKMMSAQFDKGLSQLKAVAESKR